jgi:poly-gamma-glutamate synthesis protein (capsule biosynthesis protein)
VNLAHNHIQDKGREGIIETIEHLDKSGVHHFGAGLNIQDSKNPFWITPNLCIIGYCQYETPTLTQIQLATDNTPGVNPLDYDSIQMDLDRLEKGQRAILYFHWGREHVWLPQYKNIQLAKRLLKDDRVELILGMHAHRTQG